LSASKVEKFIPPRYKVLHDTTDVLVNESVAFPLNPDRLSV